MANRIRERSQYVLAGLLGSAVIRVTRRLMRLQYLDRHIPDRLRKEPRPYILAFWHGRMFMMPYAYREKKIAILISRHRDGEYIHRAMRAFGYSTTRGSSTAGGSMALRALLKRFREGYDLAFTPDGPRGPRHQVQPGVIQAARLTGGAILPVSFGCSKKNFSIPGIVS
ncbi:MAG: lysophospholipid acyltransferase family protein [Acidobacteriota bacterium]